jgi:hypothetical protein
MPTVAHAGAPCASNAESQSDTQTFATAFSEEKQRAAHVRAQADRMSDAGARKRWHTACTDGTCCKEPNQKEMSCHSLHWTINP